MPQFQILKTSLTLGSLTCPAVYGVTGRSSKAVEDRGHLVVRIEIPCVEPSKELTDASFQLGAIVGFVRCTSAGPHGENCALEVTSGPSKQELVRRILRLRYEASHQVGGGCPPICKRVTTPKQLMRLA